MSKGLFLLIISSQLAVWSSVKSVCVIEFICNNNINNNNIGNTGGLFRIFAKKRNKNRCLIETFLPAAVIKINSTIHKPISTFILSRVHIARRYSLL